MKIISLKKRERQILKGTIKTNMQLQNAQISKYKNQK